MNKVLELKANITEEERNNIFKEVFGIDFDTPVNYEDVIDLSLVALVQKEKIETEMIKYVINCIMQEYGLSDEKDAYINWEAYKKKQNIQLKR